MEHAVSIPTLEPLANATLSFNGSYVTVLFRDRDRMTAQFKAVVSFEMARPVLFIFNGRQEWWVEGINTNPFGGPAISIANETGRTEYYHLPDGSLGCDYAPARLEETYHQSYVEEWIKGNSVKHRSDGGPATVAIDYSTPARVTWADWNPKADYMVKWMSPTASGTHMLRREMSWYHQGKCTNSDTWAHQIDTGVFETFETVQPMGLMRTTVTTQRELRWYNEQEQLHRTDGPAVFKLDGVKEIEKSGKEAKWKVHAWAGYWYINGREIPSIDIIRWAKKHGIVMWQEPCYNRSMFSDESGELCFITDFVGALT